MAALAEMSALQCFAAGTKVPDDGQLTVPFPVESQGDKMKS